MPILPSVEEKVVLVQTPIIDIRTSSTPIMTLKEVVVEPIESSCVRYAEFLVSGIPIINAVSYPTNTINPVIGDIIKIQFQNDDGFIYHIGVITGETENTWITDNGNIPTNATSTIEFKKDDSRILGYFNMERQRLINALPKEDRDILWCESGWSMYETDGSILFGMDDPTDGWGVSQITPSTWKWLTQKRREENVKPILLDKMNFEDHIIMYKYGKSKGVSWYAIESDCFKRLQ